MTDSGWRFPADGFRLGRNGAAHESSCAAPPAWGRSAERASPAFPLTRPRGRGGGVLSSVAVVA